MAEHLPDEVAISHLTLMQYYVTNARLDSAEWHYEVGMNLPAVEQGPVHQSDFLMLKATVLKNQGNIKGAIGFFLHALSLLEEPSLWESLTTESLKIDVSRSKSILHNNLANLY